MNAKRIRALQERKAALLDKAKAITAAAETDNNRDLTEEESTQFDAHMADLNKVVASIAQETTLAEAARAGEGYQIPDDARIEHTGEDRRIEDPTRGFASYGDFAMAVYRRDTGQALDERLMIGAAAPSTYSGEGVGADGGLLVPPQFSTEIWDLSLEEDSFLPLTDQMPISGNSMVFPSDETTPWGTDGVRAYWEDEAAAATATKVKLQPNEMRLKKLTALVPVSDELLADSVGLPSYLTKKSAVSIRWKTNDSIINGSGTGKPKGIMNAGALVTQAKVSGQTADTINATNIVNMFARNLNPGRGVWLINPDSYPQLPLMTIGNQPVYITPNGLQGAVGGSLNGRPVILTDTCQTLGDLGDILFIDFKGYRVLTKAGGIETATSMHLYFDASAMAFRAVFRIAGQPVLRNEVTPPNSAITRSSYVALAARA